MKTIFIVLLSAALFAQNPYPDTLLLKDGRSFPCLISSLDESNVEIIYLKGRKEKTSLLTVEHIYLDDKGIIYTAVNGFKNDPEQYKASLNARLKLFEDQHNVDDQNDPESLDNDQLKNKWSFGILLIPYYSGVVYTIEGQSTYPPYEPYIYSSAVNQINMEAQLAYALLNEISLTLDLTYTASYYERRQESHVRNQNGYEYDSGSLSKSDLTLLDFTLGIKYYFKNIMPEQVRIYAMAGLGKQFAFAEEKYEQLFQDPPPIVISEDNGEEFIEDSNSPFHFNLGFGAEYFFNESLSLNSNIRFFYSTFEAEYNSRQITEFETYTTSNELKKSDFITRVGIGLNFYF